MRTNRIGLFLGKLTLTMIENDRFTAFVFFLIGGKLTVLIGRQHFIVLKVVQQPVALSIILVPRDVHLYNNHQAD